MDDGTTANKSNIFKREEFSLGELLSRISSRDETTTPSSSQSSPLIDPNGSDNDEYTPTNSRAGFGRGRGGDKRSRYSRSNGKKPQTNKYSNQGKPEKPKRGRGACGRGRGCASRGSKMGSNSYSSMDSTAADNSYNQQQLKRTRGAGTDIAGYIRTPIVTSSNDQYVAEVLLCLVCGSVGLDAEGELITCMNCAQSFHTYCVNLKNKHNPTLSKRGWRCLDCTICEECGKSNDELNLIFCDNCDQSFHTYCVNQPSQTAVQANPWRCRWCATCYRCNKRIIQDSNSGCIDGLCEMCTSLRKCPKCEKHYNLDDLLMKCQRCSLWMHSGCENCYTEEQAENAIENAFRCSSCRPKVLGNDRLQIPIVVDNVMVCKSAADTLTSNQSGDLHSLRIRFHEKDVEDNHIMITPLGVSAGSNYVVRPTVGRGRGRRMFRIGVGGFVAKTPRHRLPSMTQFNLPTSSLGTNEISTLKAVDEINLIPENDVPLDKPKMRRQRKSRRPKLEDAYPSVIQESFFGFPAVDSRLLFEQTVKEPLLHDYNKAKLIEGHNNKDAYVLSEHSSELLRNEQVQDMLGDMLGDNLDLADFENLDFADLIDNEYEHEASSPIMDGTSKENDSENLKNPENQSYNRSSNFGHQHIDEQHTIYHQSDFQSSSSLEKSASSQAIESWEKDEPLGDKATKAAVLYANVHHSDLKEKYPLWQDRVKVISRIWRELNAEARKEFVNWARQNRANCPESRKRRRMNSFLNKPNMVESQIEKEQLEGPVGESEVVGQSVCNPFNYTPPSSETALSNQSPITSTYNPLNSEIFFDVQQKTSDNASCSSGNRTPNSALRFQTSSIQHQIATFDKPHQTPYLATSIPIQPQIRSTFDQKLFELQNEQQTFEAELERVKKIKRHIASDLRQLLKDQKNSNQSNQSEDKFIRTGQLQNDLEQSKKSIQQIQRQLEKSKSRIKEYLHAAHASEFVSPRGFYHSQEASQSSTISQNQSTSDFHLTLPTRKIEMKNHYDSSNRLFSKIPIQNVQRTQQSKGTRGRKRKTDTHIRSLFLGGTAFTSLGTQLEKDVYDVIDTLLHCVDLTISGSSQISDELIAKIKRNDIRQVASGSGEIRMKKKRFQLPKPQQPDEDSCSLESAHQRLLNRLRNIPLPRPSLTQYDTFDKSLLHFLDQTFLPARPPFIFPKSHDNSFNYQLSFMSDNYELFEKDDKTLEVMNSLNFDEALSNDLLKSNSGKVDVRLVIDSSVMSLNDLIKNLCKILGVSELVELKTERIAVDTPPQTPPMQKNIESKNKDIKNEIQEPTSLPSAVITGENVLSGKHPITQTSASNQKFSSQKIMLSHRKTITSPSDDDTFGEHVNDDFERTREIILTIDDLIRIAEAENTKQLKTSEYKWKEHGWLHYSPMITHSFQLCQKEPTKRNMLTIFAQNNREFHKNVIDKRICLFCLELGDGKSGLTGRLLNVDANEWVHVNCALWSAEVYETKDGALMNVETALNRARQTLCILCKKYGASIRCYRLECSSNDVAFHLTCAKEVNGYFSPDKLFYCPEHSIRTDSCIERLDSLRRIYIHRDENRLLSKIFNHTYSVDMMMRIGNMVFHKLGQLLPEQLKLFHNNDFIYPIGYKISRLFWSANNISNLDRYTCEIRDSNNSPRFSVRCDSSNKEYAAFTAANAWFEILNSIVSLRENASQDVLKFHSHHLNGEKLFGLVEPTITKMIESLPGIDQLFTYSFKFGGSPLLEIPLAVNPSGCARCEPCLRTLIKRHTRPIISSSPKKENDVTAAKKSFYTEMIISRESRSTRNSSRFALGTNKMNEQMLRAYKASGISERMLQTPYAREPVQTIAQYKDMQRNWKSTVYLARSRIQGLGLYAKRDIDMNSMLIEYIGEMIRSEVGEMREKKYSSQNRGVYMFRIDDDWFVDATVCGGCARYINHSCDPNCNTKILSIGDEKKIIVIANRPIKAGEELTYDYQFEIEDTTEKIPCLCKSPNCKLFLN